MIVTDMRADIEREIAVPHRQRGDRTIPDVREIVVADAVPRSEIDFGRSL